MKPGRKPKWPALLGLNVGESIVVPHEHGPANRISSVLAGIAERHGLRFRQRKVCGVGYELRRVAA